MNNWIKDGKFIVADYLGQRIHGRVESSRVKYGGRVQYVINLEKAVQFPWRSDPSYNVLIDDNEIVAELGDEQFSPYDTANS
jgi:hypothetical protein